MITAKPEQTATRKGVGRTALACASFFSLLPAVAAGGAIGLPLLMGLTGLIGIRLALLRQAFEKPSILLLSLATFVVWAAISSAWSPWDELVYPKILAIVALGLLFGAAGSAGAVARLSLAGAAAALVVLLALLGVEAAFGLPLNRAIQPEFAEHQLNQNPARGVVVMLALLWPALAWLITLRPVWRWPAAAVLVVGAGAVSLQFGQLSTAVGFGVGLVFFLAGFALPRLAVLAPSIGLALWMLVAPFATPMLAALPVLSEGLPHSSAVRLGIWRYTSARILEQPWIGHGLDAARATTEEAIYDGERLRAIPVHPHSASLQVWFDTGLVGALLAAALIALTGLHLARRLGKHRQTAAAAAAHLAMLGLMANIGWSIWQEWWMATLILAGALIAALAARDATR